MKPLTLQQEQIMVLLYLYGKVSPKFSENAANLEKAGLITATARDLQLTPEGRIEAFNLLRDRLLAKRIISQ